MRDEKVILTALRAFAESVKTKTAQLTHGEPEDQLRGPFENLLDEIGRVGTSKIVCTGETKLPGRIGKPDYAVHSKDLLIGYVELKAPGTGANPNRFKGHNRDQWKRFQAIPNLIYCDGNEWGLYRNGEAVRTVVHVAGDIVTNGKRAIASEDAASVRKLLTDFLQWQPIIPVNGKGEIDLRGLAALLAPLCRMLRDDVTDAMKDPESPLVQLAKEWRQLLFPDASDEQFADAYAQTVTFALLLARSEKVDPLTLPGAETALASEHSLLSRALQVLTDPNAQSEISASLNLLIRVIGAVPAVALPGPKDPWLYFYEDFLAAYDPKLRKDAGVYYTPVEVVRAQVRLIDDLLTNRLGKTLGFADRDVVTLDPALGTGTYLLGVIEHALAKVEAQQGAGAVPGQASALAKNIYGFEIMVGPFTVSELRVSRALQAKGAELPPEGTHIYLTDTLESPYTKPPELPLILKPIADQHKRALQVKGKVPVIVCLGNPPYDRHEAIDPKSTSSLGRYGGWVRFGDELQERTAKGKKAKTRRRHTPRSILKKREQHSILFSAFVKPAVDAGHSVYVKNLYNSFVYFWRWAFWKVFEHETSHGPGIISYISASSYLDGDAFCGLREHISRLCDEIWILDLGGEGRGARKSENVFAILSPVAIALAFRSKKQKTQKPAKVHYARIWGTRDEKLAELDAIRDFSNVRWQDCPKDWQAPFRPAGKGDYFDRPLFADLMPWSGRGIQFSRTWPAAEDPVVLKARWKRLLSSCGEEQKKLLKETRDVKTNQSYLGLITGKKLSRLDSLSPKDKPEAIVEFTFRSFDHQWCIADRRLIDMPRPPLWHSRSQKQIFMVTLSGQPFSEGPVLVASPYVPDINAFNNRGGVAHPLFRSSTAKEANILPGLLELLGKTLKCKVKPEDFLAYMYGALAHSAFASRYSSELETRELRVPITKDATLFEKVREVGARLLWLHTRGEQFVPKGHRRGQIRKGKARCFKPVPSNPNKYPENYEYNYTTKTLRVGTGQFCPITSQVCEFEVSGLKVVQSWLKYRMKRGGGKKSSPLDDIRPERWTNEFTTELLELLWVLEATLAQYPMQAKLLTAVVKGPCFRADELPAVPDAARKPPSRSASRDLFD